MSRKVFTYQLEHIEHDAWRIFRIMSEFVTGFEELNNVDKAVTIFGSRCIKPGTAVYEKAVKTAKLLSDKGYTVISGGGSGIMEAANKGGCEGKVKNSIGLNITLPEHQSANQWVKHLIEFKYFFVRKVMFVKYAKAFIIFPGGFGTFDELFETITLVQTHLVQPIPIVLVHKEFWQGLDTWLKTMVKDSGCIFDGDIALYSIVDTAEEAAKIVDDYYKKVKASKASEKKVKSYNKLK